MNREDLTEEEARQAVNRCLEKDVTNTEMAAFLSALKTKGETAEEMTGITEAVRQASSYQNIYIPNLIDNCGTGGDQSNSFNISTTAAFVIAASGVKVAKHGNRSISSKTGSADLLEELGIALDFTPEEVVELIDKENLAFLFAPHIHASLKTFIQTRSELGIPTVFNLIGPLTNPLDLDTQLLGVYRRDMLLTLGETLKQLGRKRAVVVNGAGYMDEASLQGDNHLVILDKGILTETRLHPHDVGLDVYDNQAILGGDAKENKSILYSVLNNEQSPYLDTVLLNAGLALFANGKVATIRSGVELASETIASGKALDKLNALIDYSNARMERIK